MLFKMQRIGESRLVARGETLETGVIGSLSAIYRRFIGNVRSNRQRQTRLNQNL
jgi:hypothetical protein